MRSLSSSLTAIFDSGDTGLRTKHNVKKQLADRDQVQKFLKGSITTPDDFEQRYESVWITPPNAELCDPVKVAQYYKWNLDELELAGKEGSLPGELSRTSKGVGHLACPVALGRCQRLAEEGRLGVAVGDFGTILVTKDGGAHWERPVTVFTAFEPVVTWRLP